MRWIAVFVLCALLGAVPCLGAELTVPGLDELWQEAEGYGVEEGTGLDEGLSNLLADGAAQAGELLRASLSTALKLMAVVLLCALAQGVQPQGEGLQPVTIAGALAVTALTMTDMAAMIGLGRETLGRMEAFSQLLLPVVAVLTAATGGISGAAVRQSATVLFSQLLLTAMDRLLIPLVYAYVAVSCAHAAVGNPGLERLARPAEGGGRRSAHRPAASLCGLPYRQRGHRRQRGRGGGEDGQAGHLPGHPGGGGRVGRRL